MRFHQSPGSKVRPALIILDTGDEDFVAAPVTSQARPSEFDLAIKDWNSAGLNVQSYIRVHKVAVLPKSEIVRRLGVLSDADRSAVCTLLCQCFCQPKA